MGRRPKLTSEELVSQADLNCCPDLDDSHPGQAEDYLNSLVTAVWIYDIENYCIVWANEAALALWESESLEELKSRDFKPGASDAVQQTLKDYQQIFKSGKSLSRIWRYSPKGILKEAYCQLSGYTLSDGRIAVLTEAITVDLIDNNSGASSVITLSTYDMDGHFISGNPPFLETQNHDYSHLKSLFPYTDDYQKIRNIIEHTGRFEGDVQIYSNKQILWHRLVVSICEHDNLEASLLVQQFNIDDMKNKELALEKEVITDPLTGLLNRRGLKNAVKDKGNFVIFYIDLDGFKLVNDSLGHTVGDQVLRHMGTRLTSGLFQKGHACRFGGDEFIWLIDEEKLKDSVEKTANSLLKAMNQPFIDSEDRPVTVSASVGVAHYPRDGKDFEDLVLKADAAMYLAKKQGKHCWVNYISGMESSLQRHSQLAQYLYKALENQEFQLYYQPIFDTKAKRIHSFEALLRWDSVDIGRVPTDECIRVAEEIGIITDIEKWVIDTAIGDLNLLRGIFDSDLAMAINVSSQYFSNSEFVSRVVRELNKKGLSGSAINIELTEGTLLSDLNHHDNAATRVNDAGIPISIDDFGTGYSSLAYLHQIPATLVKIDGSFTRRVEEDSTMIMSIKHLIESLKLNTIVEGVETAEQSKILNSLGLFLQQGYGLGLPQPLAFYQDEGNVRNLAGLQ
ncbi:EAL domain-containing protein [Alteromonadaceae bacterium M269]|nr:EAL domain-containing protein [Alteromonadaceae bacterium M269]